MDGRGGGPETKVQLTVTSLSFFVCFCKGGPIPRDVRAAQAEGGGSPML
jgi:hypothetical protein